MDEAAIKQIKQRTPLHGGVWQWTLAACPHQGNNAALLRFLLLTGLRISEG